MKPWQRHFTATWTKVHFIQNGKIKSRYVCESQRHGKVQAVTMTNYCPESKIVALPLRWIKHVITADASRSGMGNDFFFQGAISIFITSFEGHTKSLNTHIILTPLGKPLLSVFCRFGSVGSVLRGTESFQESVLKKDCSQQCYAPNLLSIGKPSGWGNSLSKWSRGRLL